MSVLKGAAASALYGSRAANGVVLITTKSGSKKTNAQKGLEVTLTGSYTIETISYRIIKTSTEQVIILFQEVPTDLGEQILQR